MTFLMKRKRMITIGVIIVKDDLCLNPPPQVYINRQINKNAVSAVTIIF